MAGLWNVAATDIGFVSNVAERLLHRKSKAIVDAVYAQGIYSWNGQGRVRISFHGYNTIADAERNTEALISQTRP